MVNCQKYRLKHHLLRHNKLNRSCLFITTWSLALSGALRLYNATWDQFCLASDLRIECVPQNLGCWRPELVNIVESS